jgi:endogenous inhibitor of DNA gyrase (YacG/DUF329 family)
MKLKCPICKKKEVALGEPDFPFCSERCRLIDLGKWAAEEYRIPVAGDPHQPESDEEAE